MTNKFEKVYIETKRASYVLLPSLGILVNSELESEFDNSMPDVIDEEKLIENLRKAPTDEYIEDQLSSIKSITLNITDSCSFRCKYCAYSGNYELVRAHNNNSMDIETAKKIIEHLIRWINNKKRKAKSKFVNISFYGGEPLLEYKLIKDIIKFTKERFNEPGNSNIFEPVFRLNTNGYHLNDEIVDFLVKNNLTLDVSLDGPKEEHDKFRLTRDGGNTWDIIWKNLKKIKIRYPDYYAEKVDYLVTLHPSHNFDKIDNFFIENSDYFDLKNVRAYFVNNRLLKESIKNKWFKNRKPQKSRLFLLNSSSRLDNKLILQKWYYRTKFSAMCFPVEAKLFVDSNGTFHICEKVKPHHHIGDSNKGIDFDAVRKIHLLWNEEIIRNRCWECPAWSFCNVCLAQSEDRQGVKVDCTFKNQFIKTLTDYVSFKEEEEIRNIKDLNFEKYSVRDYLRQL